MSDEFFPEEILALSEAAVTFPGVRGRLLQGPGQQLVFFEIDAVGEVEPHSHGAQWGVVLDGAMDLTQRVIIRTNKTNKTNRTNKTDVTEWRELIADD